MNYQYSLGESKFSIFICDKTKVSSHSHNFLELAYVLEGEATHTWDNHTADIKKGDYFVVDYNSQHYYRAKTESLRVINCIFMPELIDPALISCQSLSTVISNYQIHFKNEFFTGNPRSSIYNDTDGKIKEHLLEILKEFENKEPGFIQIIRSKLIEILVTTMRKIYFDPKPEENESNMSLALRYINSHYMNDISLKDICLKFNYSLPYLSAKFKKEFGISYTSYLQKIRTEQSMRLLAHTNMPVSEVSQAVGYRDIKAFYTVFKKFAGTTPANFRKNYNSN